MRIDDRHFAGWTEGPLGIPMPDETARYVERTLRDHPQAERFGYQRRSIAKAATDLVEAERTEISVISTEAIDRDREIVRTGGIELSQFRRNPIVTFAHRYDQLPVGRALWIRREGEALKAKTRYAQRPEDWTGDWLPDAVWSLVRAGDLLGKSIGFLPLEGRAPTADEIRLRPALAEVRWIYVRTLLLEYSVAPLQSNPEAVVESVGKRWTGTERSFGPQPLCGTPLIEYEGRAVEAVAEALATMDLELLVRDRLERRLGRV